MEVKVLVVGDVGLDLYIRCSTIRLCPEAPVPVLNPESEEGVPGLAGNVAANLVAMGASPRLISVVGDDQDAFELKDALSRAGVGGLEKTLIVDPERKTTVKQRYVVGSALVCRVDLEVKNPFDFHEGLLPEFRRYILDCDAVVVQDYGKGFVTPGLMREVVASGKPVVVDPYSDADPSLYVGATILKPNKSEYLKIRQRLGVDTPPEICEVLGIGGLVVTYGADGMKGHQRSTREEVEVPGYRVESPDVCGAGDAVAASLAIGLAMRADFKRMIEIANAAGAAAVGVRGTSVVTAEMVGEVLRGQDGNKG